MVRAIVAAVALAASLLSSITYAAPPACGAGNKCPSDTPCCSQYGQCGVGAYCLGGCDPLFSNSFDSCVPAPVCKSTDYQLKSLDDVQPITKYLGDASKANWVSSGNAVVYNNDALLLTMAPDTVGTLLATTHYVWYGKISASLTTSQGAGVVTAFIMMSDVKDEIDFEFVGVDIEHAQTNYYSQGVTDYNNGANLSVSNTVSTAHTYTIDWKPDSITWAIDGKVMRTKLRSETWNSTSNRYDFPQTPSRVMLSLWPAGLPTNGQGTINWAGGLVDWNSQYMQKGYYYAMVNDVSVECYDPPSGATAKGSKSYIYTDAAGTNNTIQIVDKQVVLKNLMGTGQNPGTEASGTSSKSATASQTAAPETVPGISGAGERGGESGQQSAAVASGTASANTPESTESTGGSDGTFQQGTGSASGAVKVESVQLGSSLLAAVIAMIGLCVL